MFSCGVPAIDKLLNGFPDGRNIQLVGVPDSRMTEIGLNMLQSAEKPVYFNLNGMLSIPMAEKIIGKNLMIHNSDDSEEAMSIIEYMVTNDLADRIVIDDLPTIVSEAERNNTGTELESIELISKTLMKIKMGCMKKGITIIWINQARGDNERGMRIWGGDFITQKMQATILCEPGKPISDSHSLVGFEVSLKVVRTKAKYARRRTTIGVFNTGEISYSFWVFKEAQRYHLIKYGIVAKNGRHGFIYKDKPYQNRWKIINLINGDEAFRNKILK